MDLKELLQKEPEERLPSWKWQELREIVLKRDDYLCVKCKKRGFEVDHILPVCMGGENKERNLQTLCTKCHQKKTEEDLNKLRKLKKLKNLALEDFKNE